MATTTYLRLFPAVKQFELKNGALNVGGRLFVYYDSTDDLAEIYDENGTRLQQPAILDNDGRALGLFVDAKKVYRLEVQDAFGAMQFTVRKMVPSGGGTGSALGKVYDVVSNDGSILVDKFDEGGTTTFDLSLGIDANELKPSCLKASAAPVTTDGKFVFEQLTREGNLLSVDGEGKVRMEPAWYHFTAIVELSYDGTPVNEAHQVTLWTTLSNSVIDLDTSYAHRESIELSGDIHVVGNNTEFPLGVSGLDTGITASLMGFDIHAVTGHEGSNEYHAGEGITIANATKTISADFESVQEKLVAGENISITGNVISAGNFSQEQADWTEEDTTSPAYIQNKPDLDEFATKTEVNAGLAGKQNTIPDLAQIRAGAASGSSAVQPADLAAVATTGDYNSLNNRPNLTVYATKTEVNTGLAAKQDVISDLSAIRAGAQAGATAVQPAALDSYATKVELNTGLSGKQDTIDDLSTIRSGAAAGASALQPSDVATVATTGDYDDLIDKPTIPSGAQLVPTATSADADKVLTVDAQGVPAWAAAKAPISAGDGISISNNVVSAKVDGTTVTVNASGELQAAPAITVDQTYDASSSNAQSGTAVAQAIGGVDAVPDVTSSDNGKVLVANYSGGVGSYSWASNPPANAIILDSSSTWADFHTPYSAGRKDIYYKHTSPFAPFESRAELYLHLTAVSDVDGSSTNFTYALFEGAWNSGGVDYSVRCKFRYSGLPLVFYTSWAVDKSYSSSSRNAQSGVAVAQAISAVNQVPSSTSADADKVLTVNSKGTPAWASAQAPISAGTGISITNNVVSVDTSVVATQTDLASKQDTISDLATIRSGAAEGATAVQPGDLATVATTGSYDDLANKPTIPAAQVNSDWNSNSGVSQILNKPTLATVATTGDYDDLSNKPSIPAAQVNSDWNAVSGVSEILNKPSLATVATTGSYTDLSNTPTIPGGTQLVPAATSADADKVLTVNAQGTPAWASAQAPISAGTGIDITNNVVSVDTSVVATQTDLAGKEDEFDVGTGLEMDTSGAIPTLQVEAPVDIVAGPGIVIDNPDGNTLRVSVAQAEEVVLYDAGDSPSQAGPWQISEARTNFEWVDIVFGNDRTGSMKQVTRFAADSEYMKLHLPRYDEEPSYKWSTMTLSWNNTTASIKTNSVGRFTIASNGSVSVSTAAAQAPYLFQIIGIHRIQGGS